MTGDSNSDTQNRPSAQRRSRRLYVQIRVRAKWSLEDKTSVSEDTETFVVSPYGALIRLGSPLPLGQRIALQNTSTYETQESVVVFVSKDATKDGRFNVGIEFTKPNASFWRVAFPPEGWSPSHPDAKA